jgi:hypothetical protein
MVGSLQVSLTCVLHRVRMDRPARTWIVLDLMPVGQSLGTDFGPLGIMTLCSSTPCSSNG